MEKVFENLKELMDFDFSELTASKSNYITVLAKNGLPKVKKSQNFTKWRVVERPKNITEPKISMELTPRWLTITIYLGKSQKSRRIDIDRFKRDPKVIIQRDPKMIIQEIFEV